MLSLYKPLKDCTSGQQMLHIETRNTVLVTDNVLL